MQRGGGGRFHMRFRVFLVMAVAVVLSPEVARLAAQPVDVVNPTPAANLRAIDAVTPRSEAAFACVSLLVRMWPAKARIIAERMRRFSASAGVKPGFSARSNSWRVGLLSCP